MRSRGPRSVTQEGAVAPQREGRIAADGRLELAWFHGAEDQHGRAHSGIAQRLCFIRAVNAERGDARFQRARDGDEAVPVGVAFDHRSVARGRGKRCQPPDVAAQRSEIDRELCDHVRGAMRATTSAIGKPKNSVWATSVLNHSAGPGIL